MAGRDFSVASHLPQQRPDGEPESPERLPRQRRGITPQLHGRYPDHDVLAQAGHWDQATREVVLERAYAPMEMRFFTAAEAACLGAFCDIVMAQDREPKVPVLAMIDAKLYEGRLDGYRYADLPDDRETWRLVARGLDAALLQHGCSAGFALAPSDLQYRVTEAFANGALHGEVWDELPCARAWSVVMRGVLSAFYSHPWAWNEIGFPGPAYPRGYARLGAGQREPWEAPPASERDPVREDLPE